MAANFQDTRFYNCHIDLFLNELRSSRLGSELNFTLKSEELENNYILFKYHHGVSMSSWGEVISVSIILHPEEIISLTIHSECRMPTQIIDLGKNKKNVTNFFSHLEKYICYPSILTPISSDVLPMLNASTNDSSYTVSTPTPQLEQAYEPNPYTMYNMTSEPVQVAPTAETFSESSQASGYNNFPQPAPVAPVQDYSPEPIPAVAKSDTKTSYDKTGYFFNAPMDLSDDAPMTPYTPAPTPTPSHVTPPTVAVTPAPITVSSIIEHNDNGFAGPTVICSSCGNKIPKSDDKFCPLCGNML